MKVTEGGGEGRRGRKGGCCYILVHVRPFVVVSLQRHVVCTVPHTHILFFFLVGEGGGKANVSGMAREGEGEDKQQIEGEAGGGGREPE